MADKSRKVVFVMGPTASGKSEWALQWAEEFGGVIFNCDSIQVYQKVEIGTAKPTVAERARVPHYLLDYVRPPQEMTAGQYTRDFFDQLENVPAEKPVFVVGGTGFYFMAIEKGMYPVTVIPEEIQKQVLAEMSEVGGPERLYQEVLRLDPEYGQKIHLADHYRIGRAVELLRTQGKSMTEIQAEFEKERTPFPYPLYKTGPVWERDVLRERIALRTSKMLAAGLVQEVRELLAEGLGSWGPLGSVGYKEVIEFLEGRGSLADLHERISTNTRQLAKRQRTWFQRDPNIHWHDGNSGFAEAWRGVENFLKS